MKEIDKKKRVHTMGNRHSFQAFQDKYFPMFVIILVYISYSINLILITQMKALLYSQRIRCYNPIGHIRLFILSAIKR
jgi:hypothetical protein